MEKNIGHSVDYIYTVLKDLRIATLSTISDNNKISSRAMEFSCDEELRRFYFTSYNNALKLKEIENNSNASVSIIKILDKIEDCIQIMVRGNITIIKDYTDKYVQEAFKLLSYKNSEYKDIYEKGTMENLSVMKLDTEEIMFAIGGEQLQNIPSTIIKY